MTVPATPELVVVIGAGSMGQAIARRIGVGKTILLADLNEKAAAAAAAPPLPEGVVKCFGEGLRRVTWPVDAAGTATWTFLVDRR